MVALPSIPQVNVNALLSIVISSATRIPCCPIVNTRFPVKGSNVPFVGVNVLSAPATPTLTVTVDDVVPVIGSDLPDALSDARGYFLVT